MGPLANLKTAKGHQTTQLLHWIDEIDKTRKGKDALRENDLDNDLLKKKEIPKVETHYKHKREDIKFSLRSRSFSLAQITGVPNI